MKTRVAVLLFISLLLFSVSPCHAASVNTSATSAILIDADSGRVLYEQNADAQMLIASTTKILTALVAIREGQLSDVVTVSGNAASTEGSSMYLAAGEALTLEALLYGLMLSSGNDAAVAIAEHISGSCEAFAQIMNETAAELGMEHSSFSNPNGLDSQSHYSTARDMALLARAAVQNETLMRIASTKSATINGRTMTNHNKLLSYYRGCLGLKTGYTRKAGRTLVSCAQRGDQRLIAVTLQDGNDWADHQSLFDYGFAAYRQEYGAVVGQTLGHITMGTTRIPLVAARNFSWPLADGEQLCVRIELSDAEMPSLRTGVKAAVAVFTVKDAEVGRIDLLCGRWQPQALNNAMQTLKRGIPDCRSEGRENERKIAEIALCGGDLLPQSS